MGSGSVQHFVTGDALHVAWDERDQTWWAVGSGGSYGGAKTRKEAVEIAEGASATSSNGRRHIIVHNRNGSGAKIIEGTKKKGSSQFFQDSVP